MKKIITIVLITMLMSGMFGCGDNNSDTATNDNAITTTQNSIYNEHNTVLANGEQESQDNTDTTKTTENDKDLSSSKSNNSNGSSSSSGNSLNSSKNNNSSSKANISKNNSNSKNSSSKNLSSGKTTSSQQSVNYSTFDFKILNIGASDAIILKTSNNKTVLIDAGSNSDGDKVVSYMNTKGITYIDYFIVTHFDNDHIGGAPKVISSMNIGKVLQPGYDRTGNSDYTKYANALSAKGIKVQSINSDYSFAIGEVQCKIYTARKSSYAETKDNNFSLVTRFTHGNNSFLFTGDIMSQRISEVISMGSMQSDFLLMPRHGQYETNIASLIKSVKPTYTAITCSIKKPEDSRVLSLLSNSGCKYYLTRTGAINVVSDGKKITISQTAS